MRSVIGALPPVFFVAVPRPLPIAWVLASTVNVMSLPALEIVNEDADTSFTVPWAVFVAAEAGFGVGTFAMVRIDAACIVPPVSWYETSTAWPVFKTSVDATPVLPAALAAFSFVPPPGAVMTVSLSTVNVMSPVWVVTVTELPVTAETVPLAFLVPWADAAVAPIASIISAGSRIPSRVDFIQSSSFDGTDFRCQDHITNRAPKPAIVVESAPVARRLVSVALLAVLWAASPVAQKGIPPINHAKLEKLAEPWPDPDVVHARKVEAEQRRLFADADPFPFTLQADFKAINKDHNPESKHDYPGLLTVSGPDGPTILHVTLRPRGHLRRRTCSFMPLRVEFVKAEAKGTIFDGQKALKLVTHCDSDALYEQYILREYGAYRVMNLLTPLSFRARLVRPSYVQGKPGDAVRADATGAPKAVPGRIGMFIEDEEDVARRAEARVMEIPRVLFKDLEPDPLSVVMVFEYMIGNTDYSIYALHNVKLLRTQDRKVFVVPYDFDLSGLVHTSYAAPTPGLGQLTVRDRVYRGPCRPEAEIQPVLDRFKAHKDEVFAVFDSIPGLDADSRNDAKDYLQQFYSTLAKDSATRKTFVSGQCSTKSLK